MDGLATGPGDALEQEGVEGAELEAAAEILRAVPPTYLTSVTAVVSLAIMLRTVTFLRPSATTVGKVATSLKTVWSRRERESSAVTLVEDQATWLVIVIVGKSRSATLAVNTATFRKTAPRSGATGVARPATWPSTAAKRVKSTATAVASPDIWPGNAPWRLPLSFSPLCPPHSPPFAD